MILNMEILSIDTCMRLQAFRPQCFYPGDFWYIESRLCVILGRDGYFMAVPIDNSTGDNFTVTHSETAEVPSNYIFHPSAQDLLRGIENRKVIIQSSHGGIDFVAVPSNQHKVGTKHSCSDLAMGIAGLYITLKDERKKVIVNPKR